MADWQRITAAGDDFELKILPVGTFGNVVYIVRDPDTREGFVIDAGWEPDTIAKEAADMKVLGIVITHGHNDHHDELDALKAKIGAPSSIGELDQGMLKSPPDSLIVDRQELPFGKNALQAIHTPGHTPGSTCFTVGNLLFSGDTLFPGGVGNTKGQTGHFYTIIRSVEYRLFSLPDETVVYPGHGKPTTIGTERPGLPEWKERGW
jgi:glyoxylase-like metal-dependent hydrolase (beta-lactamase superfamily II)